MLESNNDLDNLDHSGPIEPWCLAAKSGDREALRKLLGLYHARLQGFLRRKIGLDWKDRIDPEDTLQEAYVCVFSDIGQFTYAGPDSFYRWVRRIAEHRFIDHVRKLRRRGRAEPSADRSDEGAGSKYQSFWDRHLRDTLTPSRIMSRDEAVGALMACIAQLPETYRMVVQRYHLNDEPISAIAADLGRSEDAVRSLAARALARLQKCLQTASHPIE